MFKDVMGEEEKQIKDEKLQISSAQTELEERAKLVDEYLDQLQRVQAEFENYRKRAIKEKEEFRKYALEGVLYELLDILDNIQRADAASEKNHNYSSLRDGINLVEKQFLEKLKSFGVTPLKVNVGDKFDPHIHHAVNHESSEKYTADTIISILQPGYNINEKVLRPAIVVVSSGQKKTEGGK